MVWEINLADIKAPMRNVHFLIFGDSVLFCYDPFLWPNGTSHSLKVIFLIKKSIFFDKTIAKPVDINFTAKKSKQKTETSTQTFIPTKYNNHFGLKESTV